MPCRATQDGWVIMESSDKMWSTEQGNGKPLKYSCLENHMNSMKRQKDRTLKDELPRLVLLLLLLSHFSHVRLCATPETAAHQAPPSLGFSRKEHWSGLPFPSPVDLPDPGIKPRSLALQAGMGLAAKSEI